MPAVVDLGSVEVKILHPALWAQIWFAAEGRLDLYVEVLSASHAWGSKAIIDLAGGRADERRDTDRADRADRDDADD